MSLTLAAIPEIERKNDQHKMSTERYTRTPANGFPRLSGSALDASLLARRTEKSPPIVLRFDKMSVTQAGIDRIVRKVDAINLEFERLGVPLRLTVQGLGSVVVWRDR